MALYEYYINADTRLHCTHGGRWESEDGRVRVQRVAAPSYRGPNWWTIPHDLRRKGSAPKWRIYIGGESVKDFSSLGRAVEYLKDNPD